MPQRLGQDFILKHRVFLALTEDGSIFEVEDVCDRREDFLGVMGDLNHLGFSG